MSNSPYKSTPSESTISDLKSRSNIWHNGPHIDSKTRNPAWITVTGKGMTVTSDTHVTKEVYLGGGRFKPSPILSSVNITCGGDFGLILELEATITCFTKSDFERVEAAFLFPGTDISTKFGYGNSRRAGYSGGSIKGFTTAQYKFNTDENGHWIAQFTAIAPGQGLLDLNTGMKIKGGEKYIVDKGVSGIVQSLAELIAYDAQVNGQKSIDEASNGTIIAINCKGRSSGKTGHIAIYHPDHLINNEMGAVITTALGQKKSEANSTKNIVYVTLGYIVDRLINERLLGAYDAISGTKKIQACKILFDEKLSKSYIAKDAISAWPTKVLILGNSKGNYKNYIGEGKNFEECTDLSSVTSNVGIKSSRSVIKFEKILIERSCILDGLTDLYEPKRESETLSPKEDEEGVLELEQFFNKIFNLISQATGGAIKLRLASHPSIFEKSGKESNLYIFDENNGLSESIKCVVFNPIDADGSTRSCQLTSDAGSKTYRRALFAGTMKSTDPLHEPTNQQVKNAETAGRINKLLECTEAINDIVYEPGALGSSQFDDIQQRALEEAMGGLRLCVSESKKYDMLIYPGIGIDITLDGVWGFLPGNAISTTQLPRRYHSANSYFFVREVVHSFQDSDWSTRLSGQISFHESVNYINL